MKNRKSKIDGRIKALEKARSVRQANIAQRRSTEATTGSCDRVLETINTLVHLPIRSDKRLEMIRSVFNG